MLFRPCSGGGISTLPSTGTKNTIVGGDENHVRKIGRKPSFVGQKLGELTDEQRKQLSEILGTPGWAVVEEILADLMGQCISYALRRQPSDDHSFWVGRYSLGTDIIHTLTSVTQESPQHTEFEIMRRIDPAARGWLPELQQFCQHMKTSRWYDPVTKTFRYQCRSCGTSWFLTEEEESAGKVRGVHEEVQPPNSDGNSGTPQGKTHLPPKQGTPGRRSKKGA